MPREDSDEICKAVTGIAKALGCKDDWGHVADGIRALVVAAEHADKIDTATNAALLATITAAHAGDLAAASEAASLAFGLLGLDGVFRVRVETATTLTPGLPEGWEWIEGSTTEAQSAADGFGVHIVGDTVYIDGEAPSQAVRAVLARAGVAT